MNNNRELLIKAMAPRSDQLNSDDLIYADKTITISGIKVSASPEQPVWIYYHGDNGKPWKPSKGMMRVLAHAWGEDPDQWIGRSANLFSDPNVKFGGQAVGGIRINALSHIDKPIKMLVTVAKSKRVEFSVGVLQVANQQAAGTNNARKIAGELKLAAQSGTAMLENQWAKVPDHERTPEMVDWYNKQSATARQIDFEASQQNDGGFVLPSEQQTPLRQQNTAAAAILGNAGIEDL